MRKERKVSIKKLFIMVVTVAVILEAAGFICTGILFSRVSKIRKSSEKLIDCVEYAEQLDNGSQQLTLSVRNYVSDENLYYFLQYWEYSTVDDVRTRVVNEIKALGITDEESKIIDGALTASTLLMEDEKAAMLCVLKSEGLDDETALKAELIQTNNALDEAERFTWTNDEELADEVIKDVLNTDCTTLLSRALSGKSEDSYTADDYIEAAKDIVFGTDYNNARNEIAEKVTEFNNTVFGRLESELKNSANNCVGALTVTVILLIAIICFVITTLIMFERTLIKPVIGMSKQLDKNMDLSSFGISEFKDLTSKYNSNKNNYVANAKELELQAKIYKEQSRRDFLTKLANREMLEEYLDGMFSSEVAPFALYMLDADNFKSINDTYGHPFGDEVLKAFARILKELGRKHNGIAARYGGEEFVLTATGITYGDIDVIADEILESVRQIALPYEGKDIHFTVSVGSCYSLAENTDRRTIIQYADTALYKAKSTGKNKHCHYYPGK